jgi:hypothetical protein
MLRCYGVTVLRKYYKCNCVTVSLRHCVDYKILQKQEAKNGVTYTDIGRHIL